MYGGWPQRRARAPKKISKRKRLQNQVEEKTPPAKLQL